MKNEHMSCYYRITVILRNEQMQKELSHSTPSRESREFIRELRQNPPFGAGGNEFDLDRLRREMAARREPTIRGVACLNSQIDAMPCEWVMAPGADPDLRMLYLHGGGYVAGSSANRMPVAARISEAAGCAVLLPNYRLAPEHPFPAALEDCVRAHEWIMAFGPAGQAPARATFIAGDSAGGGLTLATLLALRDRRRPLPAAGIPLSPFADLTLASQSIQSESGNDPVMHPSCLTVFADLYLGKTDSHHPLASPVFGDYRGIPPLLIQVGEHEVIRDDSVRVANKAESDGVEVLLEVWPGMIHVFQSLELPEARQAMAHIADFMRARLSR